MRLNEVIKVNVETEARQGPRTEASCISVFLLLLAESQNTLSVFESKAIDPLSLKGGDGILVMMNTLSIKIYR